MLTGNKLFKLDSNAQVTRITTDDIPEGEYNKYSLNYADGKLIGDIILRPSSEEVACHNLLNGQKIYEFKCKDFYSFCLNNKIKSQSDDSLSNFNKSLEEYQQFLDNNIYEATGQAYCPYYVVDVETIQVYEVFKDDLIGYTEIAGEIDTEVPAGFIYSDIYLSDAISDNDDWFYNGTVIESE